MTDRIEILTNILAESLDVPVDSITPDADLLEDLGADSLMILEVLARLEVEFSVSIDQAKLAEMTSLRAINAILDETLAAGADLEAAAA